MGESQGATREAKGIGVNLLTLVAQAALPAFHVQLARFLGDGGYGDYRQANVIVDTFSLITLFGMDQAVQRQVALASAEGHGDSDAAVRAVGTALRVVIASGVVVAILLVATASHIGAFQGKPSLASPLRFLALMPIFYHATTVFLSATQARHVMKWNFWARGIFQPLSLLIFTTVVLRMGGGAGAAGAAVAGGMAVTCIAAGFFYAREFSFSKTMRAMMSGPIDWSTVTFAIPLVVTNLVWSLQGNIDTFFVGHYRLREDMGAYAACVLYVISISQIRGAFDPVVCALIPPALAKGDVRELNISIQRQTRWVALAAFPLFVLFAGFGDGLLAVFGKEFTRGAPAMAILAVGHTINALALASWAIPMSGNARYGTFVAIASISLQCVLLSVLVPRFGLTGAAISAALGLGFTQATLMIFAYRLTGVHGASWGLLRVAFAAAGAYAVGRLVYMGITAPLAVRFFVGVGSAATTYLVLAFVFGLRTDERQAVKQTVEAFAKRLPSTLRRP